MTKGYTLVELLVVLSIMAIVSIVVFVNFKTFSQDQILKKTAGDIQSFLREAQSNATSSLNCGSSSGVSWAVKFLADKQTLNLNCGPADSFQKSLQLENAQVDSIKCSPVPTTCPQTGFNTPLTIRFAPLDGKVSFAEGDSCINNASTLMIVLKNLRNNNNKCFTISKGGAIDVQ